MAALPVVTPQLVLRMESVMDSLSLAALALVRARPGNPYNVEIRQFGNATASLIRRSGGQGWWNRVRDLREKDGHLLPQIVEFYRQYKLKYYVDLHPAAFTETLGRQLAVCGFHVSSMNTVLYGLPEAPPGSQPTDVTVREAGPEEAGVVSELWAQGFEIPHDGHRETVRAIRQGWFSVPENRRYLAYVDGEPAGMAALYVHDGIGFLNVGATLPPYRRRGCHTALTRRRIADARAAGCELVIGHTGFGGQSQNNEERAGLRIAYNPVTWAGGGD